MKYGNLVLRLLIIGLQQDRKPMIIGKHIINTEDKVTPRLYNLMKHVIFLSLINITLIDALGLFLFFLLGVPLIWNLVIWLGLVNLLMFYFLTGSLTKDLM